MGPTSSWMSNGWWRVHINTLHFLSHKAFNIPCAFSSVKLHLRFILNSGYLPLVHTSENKWLILFIRVFFCDNRFTLLHSDCNVYKTEKYIWRSKIKQKWLFDKKTKQHFPVSQTILYFTIVKVRQVPLEL